MGRVPATVASSVGRERAAARPPQGPGSWGQQVSLGGRVVTPEAGDLGMGLPIRNICQEDVPSAVHCGKMFYQRSLS